MIRRLAAALWSLALLVVLLAGIPAALLHYLWPVLPHHWPSANQWSQWQRQPPRQLIVTALAAAAGWVLWAILVYAIIVDLTARTRRLLAWLPTRRLPPLPTPIQATASGIIGATLFGMPATAHPPAPPAPAPPATPTATAATMPTTAPEMPDPDLAPAADAAPATSPPDRAVESGVGDPAAALDEPGVHLPDGHGWIPANAARTIDAAAAAVWLGRRRRYRPRPITGPDRDDPDLTPLPATVTTVQAILDRRDHPDDAIDTEATATSDPAVVSVAAITPAGLPIGGANLIGPGAHAAARGLLTTALLTAASSPEPTRVIITAPALAALLDSALPATAVPARTVVTDLQQAAELLERHALDRARHTTTPPAGHGAAPPATSTMWPTLILLAQAPTDPALAARLAVALLCTHLGIVGALLGPWPHGQTWHVDEHGHARRDDTTGEDLGRLCVLSPTATTDLLALVRTAHTDPPAHSGQAPTPTTQPPARTRPPTAAPTPAGDTSTRAVLRIQILGPPGVYRTEPAQTPVPIQRSAALQALVYLAVHPHGATTNELFTALWPGPRPMHAPHRLYTPLAALRTALREAIGADVLVHDEDRYRLDPQHLDVDLWQLQAASRHAATASDQEQREQALQTITTLYLGELAQGKTWPWLTIPRETTRRLAIDAYTTLADNQPDPTTRDALMQDALRVDPANAELQHRTIHGTG